MQVNLIDKNRAAQSQWAGEPRQAAFSQADEALAKCICPLCEHASDLPADEGTLRINRHG